MKKQFALFMVAAIAFSLHAETTGAKPTFSKYNIGVGIGGSTGRGLSYRQWFENGYGFQVNAAPYISSSKENKEQQLSLGITGLKLIKEGRVVNLFGYCAASLDYNYREYMEDWMLVDNLYYNCRHKVYSRSVKEYFGAGPGIDIHFWRISLNGMTGIAGYVDNHDNYGLQITGEAAIYYSF